MSRKRYILPAFFRYWFVKILLLLIISMWVYFSFISFFWFLDTNAVVYWKPSQIFWQRHARFYQQYWHCRAHFVRQRLVVIVSERGATNTLTGSHGIRDGTKSKRPKTHPIHIYGQREKATFYISALGINWLMRIIYPIFQQNSYMKPV